MKRKVMFVDDEAKVLKGLERMLRNMRREWDMVFVAGGPEALEILDDEPFDVVVTDMRMPIMDGAQLLQKVRHRHPQTVRIVLSGQAERGLTMKTVKLAHQYLAKPCEATTLISTIERTCLLQGMLTDSSLRRVVSKLETLPCMPALYNEIVQELESAEASVQKVGRIVSRDLGMTAKILQLVNSAFFGLSRPMVDAAQAVTFLGLETVKSLVLGLQIFSQFEDPNVPGFSLDALWSHSFSVAAFAKAIAEEEKLDPAAVDQAFMAGLLHDLGKLIFVVNFGRYAELISLSAESGLIWKLEERVFQTTHSEVGAYLLGIWGLPEAIIEGVAFHHYPQQHLEKRLGVVGVVHAADALAHEVLERRNGRLEVSYFKELGLDVRIDVWRRICTQRSGETG
ncbi:MAG: HDOD domain-containing protein [Deltaproteobacteria bacterium]|nr:HDOD domain-containing protein [Deltaproteobacteria bacterium]